MRPPTLEDLDFIHACNAQARAYREWRIAPTPRTEKAMKEAIEAVRAAVRVVRKA
jgi:hypothetical protein